MEQKTDQNEFKTYLARLTKLTPRQHRKLLDVLRVKENAEVMAETLDQRIAGSGRCPHCGDEGFHRWGRAKGLQRYRCKYCLRTFNAVTGTPLARLWRKAQWLEYA